MKNDLICFSHLRWNFVYQRPQHLMNRAGKLRRVFYFEEPVFTSKHDKLSVYRDNVNHVTVVTPQLMGESPDNSPGGQVNGVLRTVFRNWLTSSSLQYKNLLTMSPGIMHPWPGLSPGHLTPRAIVYDCMDELSAFKFAPAELVDYERKLLAKADLVFTGGHKLFQAKKAFHINIYPFPSAIDKLFFFPARTKKREPDDQIQIPHPRLGFFGVIDERFDIELVRKMADLKPDWQFVFIGPVVKIDESTLPKK